MPPKSLVLLVSCCIFISCIYQGLSQQVFHASVKGTFRQDTVCDYCDCPSPTCTWVDNFTCPTNLAAGADDNQQRWGNCIASCLCFTSSGIGVQGFSNVVLTANDDNAVYIAKLTHYNNQVQGGNPERLRLTITMSAQELSQNFVISYPLDFIETNNNPVQGCDPAIQRSNVKCDDRFSFVNLTASDSFLYQGINYTLQTIGFVKINTTTPLRDFITTESQANVAYLLAKITTFCPVQDCGPNAVFQPLPVCGCVCSLTDQVCQQSMGPDWVVDPSTCACVCNLTADACPVDQPLDPQSCGCGCNISSTYCQSLNPLFSVAPAPAPCGCGCDQTTYLTCYNMGQFYKPLPPSCGCVCEVTDDLCAQTFGSGYKKNQDSSVCGCVSGGGGITTGQIVGIVVGSVAGALLLLLLALLLAGLLVWLILSGKIPGIYGVRVDQAEFTTANQSPLYQDVWSTHNPVAE